MDKHIRTDIGGNEMKIYHTETQADYDSLMVELEEQGAKWSSGTNPTEANHWSEFKRQTGVRLQNCILTYHGVGYYERANPETPIVKYTAKKETQLPEWAKWVARDEDGELYVFEIKPVKETENGEWFEFEFGRFKAVEETDDTFETVKWEDEHPTIVDKDGVEITVGEITSISFEEAMALVENKMEIETDTNKDMVNQPNHYIGEYGLEVEDVLRNFIPRYTDPYVGHRIASAIEYLLRSPLKNGQQDIEKARKNLHQALIYMEEEK